MKKADQIEIRPVSYRNQKVVTSMIDGLCKDLQATGLSVSHSWHDGGRLEVCISDGSAVIYDVTEVYPFKSDSTGEIVIANRLARLLELKIVENRIDDLYFDALYLGWRLSIAQKPASGCMVDWLQVYMNDSAQNMKYYPLTYAGIAEFEEDLARARLRRDVTFEIATKSHRAEIRLTTEGFTVDGEPYELTKQDIARAKEEHPALKGTFMLTAAERAYDEVAENL